MHLEAVAFPTVEQAKRAHARMIADFGGTPGIRDEGLLASALAAPRSGYFDTFAQLAAALAYGLAKNHPFLDGNKRTAAAVTGAFLRANGFRVVLDSGPWIAIFVGVAAGAVSRGELAEHLEEAIGRVELEEDD